MNGRAVRAGETLVVRTEQVYANCPEYLQTREPTSAPGAPSLPARGTLLKGLDPAAGLLFADWERGDAPAHRPGAGGVGRAAGGARAARR
ncbi:hypothetical protein E1286_37425 [Nonomuraea terrae]|uniref:Uncharacterized protein n=1 Tax=Nonomuraea terrae TaxID=2530383 RepID=A0A4R4Y1N7_9ACTN|nr:hypothetical protein [Nonomuraea terrae]TDD37324.1 hypothetical protein E1286_37425 [Nonomuraea terrae]